MKSISPALVAGFACVALAACAAAPSSPRGVAPLAHDVYFALNDNSADACTALVTACYERLAGIDGVTFLAAGARAVDLTRPVNDQDYDVSLHVFFVDRPALDAYLEDPAHLEFLEENRANWKSVRVFDSNVPAR